MSQEDFQLRAETAEALLEAEREENERLRKIIEAQAERINELSGGETEEVEPPKPPRPSLRETMELVSPQFIAMDYGRNDTMLERYLTQGRGVGSLNTYAITLKVSERVEDMKIGLSLKIEGCDASNYILDRDELFDGSYMRDRAYTLDKLRHISDMMLERAAGTRAPRDIVDAVADGFWQKIFKERRDEGPQYRTIEGRDDRRPSRSELRGLAGPRDPREHPRSPFQRGGR